MEDTTCSVQPELTLSLATVRLIIVFLKTFPLRMLAPVEMAFRISFRANPANSGSKEYMYGAN